MQSIVARSPGGPEVLELVEHPTPVPGPGQVLIRVVSAGVNFSDVKRRRDDDYPFPTAFPYTPGGEVAGTVEALGEGVRAPELGTRVFALVGGDGSTGYAQYALAEAAQTVPVPGDLDSDVAAGLIIAGSTAMLALVDVMDLQPGQRVLVEAAGGPGGPRRPDRRAPRGRGRRPGQHAGQAGLRARRRGHAGDRPDGTGLG